MQNNSVLNNPPRVFSAQWCKIRDKIQHVTILLIRIIHKMQI